ncbi:hypothetical protein H8959_011643 [Pygathrix nigripes]
MDDVSFQAPLLELSEMIFQINTQCQLWAPRVSENFGTKARTAPDSEPSALPAAPRLRGPRGGSDAPGSGFGHRVASAAAPGSPSRREERARQGPAPPLPDPPASQPDPSADTAARTPSRRSSPVRSPRAALTSRESPTPGLRCPRRQRPAALTPPPVRRRLSLAAPPRALPRARSTAHRALAPPGFAILRHGLRAPAALKGPGPAALRDPAAASRVPSVKV